MQHHGKPIERPFVRSGKSMQATFGRGAKGASIAQRAGMSLMQDPRNPSLEVARGAGVTKTRDPDHFKTSHATEFGTRDVRMHYPAAVAAELAEDAAEGEERDSQADQPVYSAFGDRRGGPQSHYYSLRRQREDRSELRQLTGTAYTKKLLSTAMPFKDVQSMPAHLRNDLYGHHGQVLRFDAFFKEEVPESAREAFRVRQCRILYYLDDDTLAIVEPEVRNSGLPQGNFLKRTAVPKPGAAGRMGERLTVADLNVGHSVEIFGRVYHIVDADRKTRDALAGRGIEVPPAEEVPEDEFEATLAPEQRMWGKDRYVGVKKTSMKVYMEALRGKEVAATVKRAQFLAHNRRVLSFDAVWDDRASLYGGIYRYVVQYFLEDDTIEVREVHEGNDGRDPFPMLLSRQKLPRNYEDEVSKVHGTRYEGLEAAPPGHYITHEDLRIGHTIPVYGRPLLLVNCDPATANWLREVRVRASESAYPPRCARSRGRLPPCSKGRRSLSPSKSRRTSTSCPRTRPRRTRAEWPRSGRRRTRWRRASPWCRRSPRRTSRSCWTTTARSCASGHTWTRPSLRTQSARSCCRCTWPTTPSPSTSRPSATQALMGACSSRGSAFASPTGSCTSHTTSSPATRWSSSTTASSWRRRIATPQVRAPSHVPACPLSPRQPHRRPPLAARTQNCSKAAKWASAPISTSSSPASGSARASPSTCGKKCSSRSTRTATGSSPWRSCASTCPARRRSRSTTRRCAPAPRPGTRSPHSHTRGSATATNCCARASRRWPSFAAWTRTATAG